MRRRGNGLHHAVSRAIDVCACGNQCETYASFSSGRCVDVWSIYDMYISRMDPSGRGYIGILLVHRHTTDGDRRDSRTGNISSVTVSRLCRYDMDLYSEHADHMQGRQLSRKVKDEKAKDMKPSWTLCALRSAAGWPLRAGPAAGAAVLCVSGVWRVSVKPRYFSYTHTMTITHWAQAGRPPLACGTS